MVARVRPSLDLFQCGRPEIYSGIAPIMPISTRVTTSETPLRHPPAAAPLQRSSRRRPHSPLRSSGLSTGSSNQSETSCPRASALLLPEPLRRSDAHSLERLQSLVRGGAGHFLLTPALD